MSQIEEPRKSVEYDCHATTNQSNGSEKAILWRLPATKGLILSLPWCVMIRDLAMGLVSDDADIYSDRSSPKALGRMEGPT